MNDLIANSLHEAKLALDSLIGNSATLNKIRDSSLILSNSLKAGGRLFSCGNGGSMCDAMHFAEELSGRFRNDRAPLAATAISDASHITCVANDYGYEHVFSRYLQGHMRPGDCLVAISTSGNSKSIVLAAEAAKQLGGHVVSLCGRESSPLEKCSDICIVTPGGSYADRVQELHIKVLHILIELIEQQMSS